MAFNFPNSPTEGQEFVAGGFLYKFVSPTWQLVGTGSGIGPTGPAGPQGPSGTSACTISDNAPGSPVAGTMWWNSVNGGLYIYYNDGSSSQWVQVNGAT